MKYSDRMNLWNNVLNKVNLTKLQEYDQIQLLDCKNSVISTQRTTVKTQKLFFHDKMYVILKVASSRDGF